MPAPDRLMRRLMPSLTARLLATRAVSAASSMLLEGALRPSPQLEAEAERFAAERLEDRRFLAVHWRHGDYVAYQLLTPLGSLVNRVQRELGAAGCAERPEAAAVEAGDAGDGSSSTDGGGGRGVECVVFLMTNCRNASALSELNAALAPTPLLSYAPPSPWHAHEGRRLVIEQAIAARAHAFVSSPRSAVSEYVETLRRGRRKEANKLAARQREEQRARASKRGESNRVEL